MMAPDPQSEITRLNKIITALMDQVEAGMNSQGSDFGLFQTTIMLEAEVRKRASQLEEALNRVSQSNRELKAAKDAAENATSSLSTVIENISEAFALFDADDIMVTCNDFYRQLWLPFGVEVKTGDTFTQILHAITHSGAVNDQAVDWVNWRMELHRQDKATGEMLLKDGSWIKISERKLGTGSTVVIYSDITDIKRRDQERYDRGMARKNRQLQATIDNLGQGVAVFDVKGRLSNWNSRWGELLHLAPSQTHKGIPCVTLLPAAAVDNPIAVLIFEHQTPWGSTLDVRRNPMPDGGFVLTLTDITERKEAEQDFRIAATAFETQEGIVITDANGVVLRVNQAFCTITGYAPEEVIGKTPRILKSDVHPPEFYHAMWQSILTTGMWHGEIWDRRKDGEIYPKWLTITAVTDHSGHVTHYVGTHLDITERKAAEDEIRNLAFYDSLTHLPNRRLLMDRLHLSLASAKRVNSIIAVLFIDLDNFKDLNDTMGHDKGDELLVETAERLLGCVRKGDTVARLGGDEFVIMLDYPHVEHDQAACMAQTVGEKVLEALSRPYLIAGRDHHSSASVGITLFDHQDGSVDDLLKQADLAMYQAKAVGRNALRFFDRDMQQAATTRTQLESSLRQGLEQKEFQLYFQPQIDAKGTLLGAEALLRWHHPDMGLVLPGHFIPFAEKSGLILQLGHWVLENACRHLAAWGNDPAMEHLILAVNVSARQFRQPHFMDQVMKIVAASGANPQRLKLELTESMLVDDVDSAIQKMTELQKHGIGFALDDFGTGYSSLSYLRDLPLTQLKIDRTFVRDILTKSSDAAIAHTIIALGRNLGMNVLAEGVETAEQLHFLSLQGCHAYQGFLFAHPMPVAEYEAFIRQHARQTHPIFALRHGASARIVMQ